MTQEQEGSTACEWLWDGQGLFTVLPVQEGGAIRNEESVQYKQNDAAFHTVGKRHVRSLKKNLPPLETAE